MWLWYYLIAIHLVLAVWYALHGEPFLFWFLLGNVVLYVVCGFVELRGKRYQ